MPVGIERVLLKAAEDPEFARALHEDREGALSACGVALTRTERAIVRAMEAPVLERMVAGLKANLVDRGRRALLGRTTALAALVLGIGTGAGCPRKKGTEEAKATPRVIKEDEPSEGVHRRLAPTVPGTLGIRPDRPGEDHTPGILDRSFPEVDATEALGGLMSNRVGEADEVRTQAPKRRRIRKKE